MTADVMGEIGRCSRCYIIECIETVEAVDEGYVRRVSVGVGCVTGVAAEAPAN